MNIDQQILPEIWRTIPNHSRHEISTYGKVRHIRHKKILKSSKPYNGYLQVGIYNDTLNRYISKCVHQLMASTFLGDKPKGFEVAHRNENKEHNFILNLCYLPWRENRIPRTVKAKSCIACGNEMYHNRKYCSKKCQFLYTRTVLTCEFCGKQFLRRNSAIRGSTIERGYTLGKTYCSYKCHGKSHQQGK